MATNQNTLTGKREDSEITVVGTLTNEGIECQAMRADSNNKLYTLTGNLHGFSNGDHVKVLGEIAEVSFCQQGTTIDVKSITRA
jgi:hypothetical protein